jgi:uncharacterized repeat protein (TIGR03843 family)
LMDLGSDSTVLIEHLQYGQIDVTGQFMWGSNYTFLCDVSYKGQVLQAVYKPVRGEKPLWDFPNESLAGREVAAYLVSEHGDWKMVPPTVFRHEAPVGPGSLQGYIEHDPDYHYFQFSEQDKARVRPAVLFDVVANNTDRKAGHILVDSNGKLWLIDHGVCFHVEPKLRTVIWDFAGQALSEAEITQLTDLNIKLQPDGPLYQQLCDYLNRREIQAIRARIGETLQAGTFPFPRQDRYSMPWPPV